MPSVKDGPASNLFIPLPLKGNSTLADLAAGGVSKQMAAAAEHALTGQCVCWGIPFSVRRPVVVKDKPVQAAVGNVRAKWLVFVHTSDTYPEARDKHGFPTSKRGAGALGERAADYVIVYADGSEERSAVRRQQEVGPFTKRFWGQNCFACVAHLRPRPLRPGHEEATKDWGRMIFRVDPVDAGPWLNWLWAWENPHPRKAIAAIRFEPAAGTLLVSAVTAGQTEESPIRWRTRRKAVVTLPKGKKFDPSLDENGLYKQFGLDLGQIISAMPRRIYPQADWPRTYDNRVPELSDREVLVEYAAHAEARFHLPGGRTIPVAKVERGRGRAPLQPVPPATQRVTLRVVEKGSGKPVPVKLHVHGSAGEYLAPTDRQRIPNIAWIQDFNPDFAHQGIHWCTYIDGEATIDLPLGTVYVEVSKGFEIRPIRKTVHVRPGTQTITLTVEKVLPWRAAGWVCADTHVHVISPRTALLEGAGEGVNVVNVLATQWGEMMTNVGDFDGTTLGDGTEHMVRVGTENRQHVLGHISLLGYSAPIIAPITTGGPDESAMGDPVGALLTEWAARCRKQGGLAIMPHFPHPRAEHAVTIVSGQADAVEMTSWGDLYSGIDPYSLADWYRYLNCGYMVAAVGGTDKMSAATAVGTIRTYARLAAGEPFTYETWKAAIRRGETFATYGPLMDVAVDGRPLGTRMKLSGSGGTVDVTFRVASVMMPMTRVELVVNGEVRDGRTVKGDADAGSFSVKVGRSSWLALLVRGKYPDKPEMIAAHSSPVIIEVAGTPFYAAADATSILEQIEGALAFLDAVGTRAETKRYREMRLVLTAAHRSLHNRMHQAGSYHEHTHATDHAEHH